MRLVFCGTPAFAVDTLRAVVEAGHEVALVVAQPDRPAGRGMELRTGAVKAAALELGLPVVQPETIRRNESFRAQLETIRPDAILVVAYGRIVPVWMLELAPHGCINLHGSLLPKYRGAAPIQWAVARGEMLTGVTTMRLDAGLDTGPMLLAQVEPIAPEETAADLFESLAEIGAGLMVRTLAGLEDGAVTPVAQNHAAATLAPLLTRDDGRIDPAHTAAETLNRWRGFQPWPGAWSLLRGRKLTVHRMRAATGACSPGALCLHDGRLLLGCADGAVELVEVQLEGKRRMSAADFANGFQLKADERLGEP